MKYPAVGADHSLPPESHDDNSNNIIITDLYSAFRFEDTEALDRMIGGCQAQQTSVERLNRLREANSQWKRIPIGNGPKKE